MFPSILLSCLAAGLVYSMRLEFEGRLDELRISFRLLVEDWPLAVAGLLILVFVPPVARNLESLAGGFIRWLDGAPRHAAAAAFLLLSLGAVFVGRMHPMSADEFAAVFQARIFASGSAAGVMPPSVIGRAFAPEYIDFFYLVDAQAGLVVANYWPGFALLMAPFAFIGAPFLVNPLITALSIVAVHALARRAFPDTHAGGLAVLFCLASPVFMINGVSYFAMQAHLLANTVFALLLLRLDPTRVFAAGLVGGLALLLHHPFPHALFAVPWILWLGLQPHGWRNLGVLAAGYALVLLPIGVPWALLHASLGTGAQADTAATTGTLPLLVEAIKYAFRWPDTNILAVRGMDLAKIVIWSAPGLVVLAVLGAHRNWRNPAVRLLTISAILLFTAYFTVRFDQGAGWGSRYFHPAWLALPVLAAGFVVDPACRARSEWRLLPAIALVSVLVMNGIAAYQVRGFTGDHLSQRPSTQGDGSRIIVMDLTKPYYLRDLMHNDPFLRGSTIYLAGDGTSADDAFVRSLFPYAQLLERTPHASVWSR